MRTLAALLALLLAVGGIWWALSREPAGPRVDEAGPEGAADPGMAPPAAARIPPGGLAGSPRGPGPAAPTPAPTAPGTTVVSYGSLRVRLKVPDGAAAATGVRVDVEPLGPALSDQPLAVRQEDGSWAFERLPVGRYRVRAFASGYQDATTEARVAKDEEGSAEIALVPGGEATYRASLYSGETPELLQVELLDGRGVRIGATFHTGAGVAYVAADATRKLPGEGRVQGLKPGPYRLRATSEAGESDEQAFVAKAGEVAAVELRIRK